MRQERGGRGGGGCGLGTCTDPSGRARRALVDGRARGWRGGLAAVSGPRPCALTVLCLAHRGGPEDRVSGHGAVPADSRARSTFGPRLLCLYVSALPAEAAVSVPLGCRRSLGRLDRRRASQLSAPGVWVKGRRAASLPRPRTRALCLVGHLMSPGRCQVSPSGEWARLGWSGRVILEPGWRRGSQRFLCAKGSSVPDGTKVAAQRQTITQNTHTRKAWHRIPHLRV